MAGGDTTPNLLLASRCTTSGCVLHRPTGTCRTHAHIRPCITMAELYAHMVLTLLGLEERGPQCGGERPSADPVQTESAALREHYARLITGKPDKSDKRNRDGGEGLPLPSPLALSPCPLPSPSPLALSPPPKRPTLNVPNSAHFYFLHRLLPAPKHRILVP